MSGIVIAGTHSGCGKTTIALGLLAALKKKGLSVQSFKAGPDFIDTGLHRMITGRPSRNLDLWMCGEDYVKTCFHKHSTDVDISVVEGVMGLYDGDFSTARLADVLNLPVILIVDAYGMAESVGAVVKGFAEYRATEQQSDRTIENTKEATALVAGIIFNRVASERHFKRLKNSVRGVEVLGYLPRDLKFEIPHRHLGLTVAEENPISDEAIERLADAVLENVDVEAIIGRNDCPPLLQTVIPAKQSFSNRQQGGDCPRFTGAAVESGLSPTSAPRIAIAYDKAFCFYYEDNLDLLKQACAEIIKFSPLNDKTVPEADAIYIGGGYPELYARELSKNQSMLDSIYNWAESGKPMYAECGGLMYLSQGIHDFKGDFFKMAGVLPFETQMKNGRSHLGYREIQLKEDCILGKKGDKLRGHEFHYSEIKDNTQKTEDRGQKTGNGLYKVYSLKNNSAHNIPDEGYRHKNTLGSYIHIHFGSNPDIAHSFINFIKEH